MMRKMRIIIEGGTGEACCESNLQMATTLSLLKSPYHLAPHIYETMDAGGKFIGNIQKLMAANRALDFRNPDFRLLFLKVSDARKTKSNGQEEPYNLRSVADPWYHNQLLFTNDELDFDLTKGYGRNLKIGSFSCIHSLHRAMENSKDKLEGLQAIIDEVVNANNLYQVMVPYIAGGGGGEGRTNICKHPALLRKMCIKAVMQDRHLTEEQAIAYVERTLKIAVILIGSAFRFPRGGNLDQDVSGLVAGTLANYPEDSEKAVNAFYLLEHDAMPVQAEKFCDGSDDKYRHHHAIELLAFYAIQDFYEKSDEEMTVKGPYIARYSSPGNGKTTWKTLALPDIVPKALGNRLFFDAMLIHWLKPQLLPAASGSGSLVNSTVFGSEFLGKLYGTKKSRELERAVSYEELEEQVLKPFSILLDRELLFLEWLRDICLTGKNWENGEMPTEDMKTELFPVSEIEKLIRAATESNRPEPLSSFQLDRLTECNGKSLYYTRLTPDKIRTRMKYRDGRHPKPFSVLMEELYDICADRKEKRHGFKS